MLLAECKDSMVTETARVPARTRSRRCYWVGTPSQRDPTLSSTKALSIVGKTEGTYFSGEDVKKMSTSRESFEELSHVFEYLFQIYPDGFLIYG